MSAKESEPNPEQTSQGAPEEAEASSEEEVQEAEAAEQAAEEIEGDLESLQARVQELEQQLNDYHEQLLRTRAEVDNTRRRGEQDVEKAKKYGQEGLLKELLPVKDSLEMALQVQVSGAESAEKLHKGVEMTLNMLQEALNKQGIQEINPLEEKFDPNYHQAMSTVESEGEPNRVVSVMQKGYMLNDRLVRPAMVEVSVEPSGEGGEETDSSGEESQE